MISHRVAEHLERAKPDGEDEMTIGEHLRDGIQVS